MAEAGLKIWITELTIDATDENKKAAALENLMKMFFSHPAVEGVIIWHFWNGSNWHDNEALFRGPGITVKMHWFTHKHSAHYIMCKFINPIVAKAKL